MNDYCVHHCVCPVVVVWSNEDGVVEDAEAGIGAELAMGEEVLHPMPKEDAEYHDATEEHKFDIFRMKVLDISENTITIEERSEVLSNKYEKQSQSSYKTESQLSLDKTMDVKKVTSSNLNQPIDITSHRRSEAAMEW
ncbi:hypothetical protein GUJ93_ZPchr0005g15592 [Zizania palustris]|uniref:Uncharacterized protein n=1 Tax=Zizania palustris TaxID=103762 RepID=A0A8J5SMQ3_ZIZPA|nr:hypothetical protein GUJ93_ZPchr0005g15592 [Zizania palustris]